MERRIEDPDVRLLAKIARRLHGQYQATVGVNPWVDSPFGWIRSGPSSGQRGKFGVQLVEGWCRKKGIAVEPSGDSEADRIIAGRRVEIKFSTLWKRGVYKFQQFRDQNYEFAICLGISTTVRLR